MAFPIMAVGAGLAGIGSLLNANAQGDALRAAQARQRLVDSRLTQFMNMAANNPFLAQYQQLLGMGSENFMAPVWGDTTTYGSLFGLPANWKPGGATSGISPTDIRGPNFNRGNDSLMQMLRVPAVDSMFPSMIETGDPFNTSQLFAALEPLETRALDQNVAAFRAGAGSLGQRFGSGMLRGEALLRSNALEQSAARRAGIAQQSYEAAQGRRLSAAELALQQRQNAVATLLSALGQASGVYQGGMGQQLSALGLMAGMPAAPSGSPYGQMFGDIGSLMLLWNQMGGKKA